MKQMGHSDASLYRYASMGCPLKLGSLGSCISCGVRLAAEFDRDEVVREARVLARPRNKGMEDGTVSPGLDCE